MKKLPFLCLCCVSLILWGCAGPAAHVDPVIPALQVAKKHPIRVALVVPQATLEMTLSSNVGGFTYPYGNTFKDVIVGTFSQLFEEVSVFSAVPIDEQFDLVIEAQLQDLEFSFPGNFTGNSLIAGGSLKIIEGEYGEAFTVFQGTVKKVNFDHGTWSYELEDDVAAILASLASKYAQELSSSPKLIKIVKNNQTDQYASTQAKSSALASDGLPPRDSGQVLTFKFPQAITPNPDAVAVIIGNRNYTKGAPNVDFAQNDADLIKQFVLKSLGYREGNIIDLRNATQADLISVFGNKENYRAKLFNWLRPGTSDVFVYYSGHGVPSLSTGQGYLLPVDADPSTVEFNGYPLETMYANLGKLPAKSVTVVIDACFSGNSQAGMVVRNASPAMLKVVEATAALPKATVITAASASEVASWDEGAKLGLLTRHFLEGVTGKADKDGIGNADGRVTLGELKSYLENEVTYMARRLYMRDQHPQVSGKAEMVLAATN